MYKTYAESYLKGFLQNISDHKKLSTVIGNVISQTVMTELSFEEGGISLTPPKISTPYFIIFVVFMYVFFMCVYIYFLLFGKLH